jgi:hypothetical protein
MTWRQAVSAWKQGTNGFYMAAFDANGKLLSSLPTLVKWALGIAAMFGNCPSLTGVAAFRLVKTFTPEGLLANGDATVNYVGGTFTGVQWFGPSADRASEASEIAGGLGLV